MCVPEGIRNSNPNAFPGQVRRDPGPAPAFARRVGRRRLCSSLTPPEHSDDGLPGTGEVTQASVLLLKLPANRHRPVVIDVVGKRCRCPQRECGMKTAVSGGRCAAICDPCGQRKEGARIGPHRTHAQPGSVAQNQARASGGMKPVEGVTQVLGSGHGCRTRPKQVDRLLCGDAPRVNGDQPEELSRLPCRHVHRLRTPLEGRAAESHRTGPLGLRSRAPTSDPAAAASGASRASGSALASRCKVARTMRSPKARLSWRRSMPPHNAPGAATPTRGAASRATQGAAPRGRLGRGADRVLRAPTRGSPWTARISLCAWSGSARPRGRASASSRNRSPPSTSPSRRSSPPSAPRA